MAQAYTRADSLGIYETLADDLGSSLGGGKWSAGSSGMRFLVDTPIPQIVITGVGTGNGTGTGLLSATATNALTWRAPGDTAPGTAVTIAANEHKLLEGSTANKWIRVFWDGDYSTEALVGFDAVQLLESVADAPNLTPGDTKYTAIMLTNQNALAADITSIKLWVGTLGTQRVTGSAQLSGSGAGTITTATANGFADWPECGWAHIKNGATTREIVYYTSRTATSLTVPSGGRGLLGTSAAAGANTDTVDAVPPIRIAKETVDSDNKIQVIADDETAPTGVTWSTAITSATGITHTTLMSNDNLGLWIEFDIASVAIAKPDYRLPVNIEFVTGGSTYTSGIRYNISIADTALDRYEVYAGVDADPTFTTPSATSATLPFTYALSAPPSATRDHRITVRKRNAYNLRSLNTYHRSFILNSSAALVGSEISAPQDTALAQIGNGQLLLTASYGPGLDSSPADKWLLYKTTDGTDPLLATPAEIGDIGEADTITGKSYLRYEIPVMDWNTTCKVVLRTKRALDSELSDNTNVVTAVVDSGAPAVRIVDLAVGERYGTDRDGFVSLEQISVTPDVKIISGMGTSILDMDGSIVWRAMANTRDVGRIFIDNALSLVNATISGAGTGDVEVIDADTVYLNVGGTRRANIDLAAGTISADTFIYNGTIDDCPDTGPIVATNGKLYLSIYNTSRGLWQPYIQLTSAGVLTFGFEVTQKDT